MAKESDYQASLIKWLKQHGAFVWKMQQNATTKVGVSDILFLYLNSYGFIECKKDAHSSLRPGQKEFLEAQSRYVFAEIAFPEIDEDVKLRLLDYFESIKHRPENAKKCRKCFVEGCTNLTRHPDGTLCHTHQEQLRVYGEITSERPRSQTGATKHELYSTWLNMLNRCKNKNNKQFKDYGGRGIEVCPEWQGSDGFWNFVYDMGDRPEFHTLDRIDVDGPYSPDNCRWADRHTQNLNTRRNKGNDSHNIAKRKLSDGTEVFDVHLTKNDKHFCRTFIEANEAIAYRDDMEEVLWPK